MQWGRWTQATTRSGMTGPVWRLSPCLESGVSFFRQVDHHTLLKTTSEAGQEPRFPSQTLVEEPGRRPLTRTDKQPWASWFGTLSLTSSPTRPPSLWWSRAGPWASSIGSYSCSSSHISLGQYVLFFFKWIWFRPPCQYSGSDGKFVGCALENSIWEPQKQPTDLQKQSTIFLKTIFCCSVKTKVTILLF